VRIGEGIDMHQSLRGATGRLVGAFTVAALLFGSLPARGAVAPSGDPVAARAMGHQDLFVRGVHVPLADLPPALAATLLADLGRLNVDPALGSYDLRAGRWGSLIAKTPIVPGPGVGNALTWSSLGLAAPANDAAYRNAVWQAFRGWLAANQASLGVNASELGAPSIGVYENRRLVHVYAGRVYGGIPVRDSFVMATLNSGNVVLYGTRNWGTINLSTNPNLSAEIARDVVSDHLSGFDVSELETPQLVIVPMANGANPAAAVGRGYAYRLAWSIGASVQGSDGSWEALVDARSGELLAFYDRNSYIDQKKIIGGIFPVSNDGLSPGGVPDGTEQSGYPMSRAYVFQGATQLTANSEGLVNVTGDYRTGLAGPFVRIQDGCGAVNETATASCDVLDLSTSSGTDCSRPPGHSLGDTHSARTGFYELNRLIDQAKSWIGTGALPTLPCANNVGVAEGWLNCQLPANMNINNACNAFFSPADTAAPTTGSINFYRNGALGSNVCRNTGEIAAVFDHEWGHGLDTYDDSKGVSLPGEAYADMTAILRLNTSCIGRGFFLNNTTGGFCPGNGDVCTECTGVREDDWMKHLSRMPHDLAWVLDQNPTVPGNCGAVIVPPTPFNSGPCQRGTHCEGTIIGESVWDLLKRDLPCHTKGWEAPFPGSNGPVAGGRCKTVAGNADATIDENSALVLGTRLFYLAAGGVVMGYQCDQAPNTGAPRNGGCNADSWYMNFLAADDDDGSLANGTPHMVAIENAFRRHGIACRAPSPSNLGCVATPAPTSKAIVTATPGVRSASLSWTAVPNATEYWVLRTDGVHGCTFGKTRVGRVAANAPLAFTQNDLLDGLTYYYSVVAVGGAAPLPAPAPAVPADACAGPMSDCVPVTPLTPAGLSTDCPLPPNQPPTAVADAVSLPRNHSRRVDVLSNDTDPNLDALVVASVTTPTNGGTAVIDLDSRVRYTPPAGAAIGATDGFDYTVSDGRGGTASAHVSVTLGGDPCLDPGGFTVLTDPAGDSLDFQPQHDVLSASIEQTSDGRFVFILKMTNLNSPLPPDTTWPITYAGGDGAFRFVKMSTQPDTGNPTSCTVSSPCFRYGNGSPSGAGTPADPSSSFSADGTIRIVVPGSAIGSPQAGQEFTSFLTRIAVEVPNVGTVTPDNMGGGPSSVTPTGSYEVVSCTP
jgi:trimeric autotransporter adhesin